jgi:flagellar P-ring protein precursor FlgI
VARYLIALALLLSAAFAAPLARAETIKDLASVEGDRDNQLIGYGLVVGLAGTGDQTTQTPYTTQAISNMIKHLGLTLDPSAFLQPNAVASVMVTAKLQTFVEVGKHIDVTVSAAGNAQSLRGGVLLMTELKGPDGQVYAIAQGSVLVSGFSAKGDAASLTVNIPTVGHIPDGATVERPTKASFGASGAGGGAVLIDLDKPSFGNATRIAAAIDRRFGPGAAQTTGPGQVRVHAPADTNAQVAFLADLLDVQVQPDKPPAEVVVDAQSGTVIIGEDVEIGAAAVAHGDLSIAINETPQVSQPTPFSTGGTSTTVPRTSIKADEKRDRVVELGKATRLSDIVRNLNAIGASASDLMAILDALRAAGALHARIKVI